MSYTNTTRKTNVYWTEAELSKVVKTAARLASESNFPAGKKISYSPLVLRAQEELPENRRRSVQGVYTLAIRYFGPLIDAELRNMRRQAAKAAKIEAAAPPALVPAQIAAVPAVTEVPAAPVLTVQAIPNAKPSIEVSLAEMMGPMIDHIAEEFGQLFKKKLLSAAMSAVEAAVKEANSLALGKELPAVNLSGTDASVLKLEKVGYIGGAQKGSDITLVTNGLQDCYRFAVVDSLAKIASVARCQVLVRSHHCSHRLWESAVKLSPGAKHIIELSPNAVNDLLTDRYVVQAGK